MACLTHLGIAAHVVVLGCFSTQTWVHAPWKRGGGVGDQQRIPQGRQRREQRDTHIACMSCKAYTYVRATHRSPTHLPVVVYVGITAFLHACKCGLHGYKRSVYSIKACTHVRGIPLLCCLLHDVWCRCLHPCNHKQQTPSRTQTTHLSFGYASNSRCGMGFNLHMHKSKPFLIHATVKVAQAGKITQCYGPLWIKSSPVEQVVGCIHQHWWHLQQCGKRVPWHRQGCGQVLGWWGVGLTPHVGMR